MQNKQTPAERPAGGKFKTFLRKVYVVLKLTIRWAYQLRSLVLSIPVFVCAAALALRNARLLPDMVGFGMLSDGGYQFMVSRGVAVLLPLAVTCICIVLMLCSKKMLYPWLISMFSLVLPWVIWFSTTFPA